MSGPDGEMLETYFRLMNLNGSSQVYHAALDSGMLHALESGPQTSNRVAEICETDRHATSLLLESLAALRVVECDDQQQYHLAAVTRLLLYSEYKELGNQYWRHLPTFLRSGKPLKKMDDVAESESHYQSQVAMMGWMLTPAANEAAQRLEIGQARRDLAIVDVGAGSGVWSLTFAGSDPGASVTAVDWPAVLDVTRENAAERGIGDRLTALPGNFHEVDLPSETFDLAIVANVTHLQLPDQNASLFAKLHAALRSGGELLIVNAVSHSPRGDLPLALYHLGLALRTENGRVYSPEDLERMLGDGFAKPQVIPLESPPYVVGMLLAQKR